MCEGPSLRSFARSVVHELEPREVTFPPLVHPPADPEYLLVVVPERIVQAAVDSDRRDAFFDRLREGHGPDQTVFCYLG